MCSNCNMACYGKTCHHFFTRAAEHMGVSNISAKRLKSIKDSVISDYLLQCSCTIDFGHFDVLVTDVSKFEKMRGKNKNLVGYLLFVRSFVYSYLVFDCFYTLCNKYIKSDCYLFL